MRDFKLWISLTLILVLSSMFSCNCSEEDKARFENAILELLIKKSEIPDQDTTAPKLVWEVTNISTGEITTYQEPINNIQGVRYGSRFKVVLLAEDLQSGIKEMNREVSSSYYCKGGGFGVSTSPYYPTERAFIPDIREFVFKRFQMTLDPLNLTVGCPSGFVFQSGNYNIRGSAINHKDIRTISSLTFDFIP